MTDRQLSAKSSLCTNLQAVSRPLRPVFGADGQDDPIHLKALEQKISHGLGP